MQIILVARGIRKTRTATLSHRNLLLLAVVELVALPVFEDVCTCQGLYT